MTCLIGTSSRRCPSVSQRRRGAGAREAKWASRKAVDALVSWRASIGQASWLPEHVVSSRPQRDTDAEGVVVYVNDQFILRYQP